MRRTAITFSIWFVICFSLGGAIALYQDAKTLEEFGNIQMYVSIGMAVLGGICIYGISDRSNVGGEYAEYVVESMSHDPDAYRRALAEDTDRRVHFGWMLFLAGVAAGTLTYCFLI